MISALKVALCAMVVLAVPAYAQVQPTVDLTISPEMGVGATDVTISWVSTNAVACRASGAWSGEKAANGSEVLTGVTTDRTYTISCRAAKGPMGLTWSAVTERINGQPGTPAQYRIFEASSPAGVVTATPTVVAGDVLSAVLWLPSGYHYVGVKAFDSDGFGSVMSNIVGRYVFALSASDSVRFNSISRLRAPVLQLAVN